MVQAGHIWYNSLEQHFVELGFESSGADPCNHTRHDMSTGIFTIMSVHTDNGFTAASSNTEALEVVDSCSHIWDLKDVKDKNFLVRWTIEHHSDGSIGILQAPFFLKVFMFFGILDSLKLLDTPLPPGIVRVAVYVQSNKDEDFIKGKHFMHFLDVVGGAEAAQAQI